MEKPNWQGPIFILYPTLASSYFCSHFKAGETESERCRELLKVTYLISAKADIKIPIFSSLPYYLSKEKYQRRKRKLYSEK